MKKIAVLQTCPSWNDVDKNLEALKNLYLQLPTVDFIFLPEMFNTAYVMKAGICAEALEGKTISFLTQMLQGSTTIVGGSLAIKEGENYYNRYVLIGAKGILHSYDKMHLFTPAGEARHYVDGNKNTNVVLNGICLKTLICYDLRFPYCSFNNTIPPFDLLVYAANWPESRIFHWKSLLTARAIENQCYVIGVNRVGTDENGFVYPGCSMMIDFKGDVVFQLDNDVSFQTADLNLDALNSYRKQYPFLPDQKKHTINH